MLTLDRAHVWCKMSGFLQVEKKKYLSCSLVAPGGRPDSQVIDCINQSFVIIPVMH